MTYGLNFNGAQIPDGINRKFARWSQIAKLSGKKAKVA
jgi:hypothetical protein